MEEVENLKESVKAIHNLLDDSDMTPKAELRERRKSTQTMTWVKNLLEEKMM